MNATRLLFVGTCFFGQLAFGQGTPDSPHVVTVDFLTKTVTGDLKHKPGEWVRIDVNHVNTYLYQVSLTGKDSTPAVGPVPPLLKSVFALDELTPLAAAIPVLNFSDAALTALSTNKKLTPDPCPGNVNAGFPALREAIQTHASRVAGERKALNLKLRTEVAKLLESQRRVVDSAKVGGFPAFDPAPLEAALTTFETNNQTWFQTFDVSYQAQTGYLAGCRDFIADDKDLKAQYEQFVAYHEKAQKLVNTLDTALYRQVDQLKAELLNLSVHAFRYQSQPFQLHEPLRIVTINITPREKQPLNAYEQTLRFEQKDQPFVGFSTGFFYGRLKNEVFSNRPRTAKFATVRNGNPAQVDTIAYDLTSENTRAGEWGVVGLVHFGTKILKSETLFLHGTTGVGLALENKLQPRLLLGVGLAFGRTNKLVTTLGLEIGRVQRQSEASRNPEITYYVPQTNYLKSELKGAFFFSLSYNFLNF
jgi:hypothetical protein